MEKNEIKIELLPHTPFLMDNGKFDLENAINYSAKLAGECYEPEGWSKLKNEDDTKSFKRSNFTLDLEHSTPYEHINIGMEITNIPKILAMVLNNERQCSTSEKSARYTKLDSNIESNITQEEINLYNKWMEIFYEKISSDYRPCFTESKIKKLAQENARYLISVFSSTKMIHTVPWVQLNRIISFMKKNIEENNKTDFDKKLNESFTSFIKSVEELNLIDKRALSNRKNRKLSLFSENEIVDNFDVMYSTNYEGTFAQLAQAHRHRTIEYSMKLLNEPKYFIPPIIENDKILTDEWIEDMNKVSNCYPQGMLVSISECGSFDKFILKAKERLCTEAQQEIMYQTKKTLELYKKALQEKNHPLGDEIEKYSKGARCTFPDYKCVRDCKFREGKTLVRKI